MPKAEPSRRTARCMLSIAVAILASHAARPAMALTNEEIFNYRGSDREHMLVAGARTEGQVVLYSGLIVNQMLRPLTAGFMKKYPFLKMTYYRADSEELLAKLSAEMRANSVVADVFEGSGGGEIAVEAGFTQAFHTPVLDAYP
ncbi:MAG: iron(III) transport system substrate-binding protein, partial [Alphaproteobacteria bacterium]|nr:iron(III) transport system substrate-binding protein [Alphaproteobacteria bacterium]